MALDPTSTDTPERPATSADLKALTLARFLQIEKLARHAETPESLGFTIANETRRLVRYDQAAYWTAPDASSTRLQTISGIAELSTETPYVHWLTRVIDSARTGSDAGKAHQLGRDDIPASLQADWDEWVGGKALWLPFLDRDNRVHGGMLLIRSAGDWQPGEIALLERIADAYSHAALALERPRARSRSAALRKTLARKRMLVLAALFAMLLFPVRQSALAPAEIVALDPVIVTSPLDGVIHAVHVQPNQAVRKGDLLFSLDDTALRNEYAVALKAADVAQAEYLRAAQKAFKDEASKAELSMLRARVAMRDAEAGYTGELLEKIDVHAERDGIAIFTAASDWLGKPVIVGEKVMTLADPLQTEIQLWLPVDDAISLESGAEIKLFLNTDPVNPLPGTLRQTSYEPQVTAAGTLAFQLKARIEDAEQSPRIGLKGTGKIYGPRVILASYLFRRPVAALRRFTGL